MKGKYIARHSKVGEPHRGFAWFWGTPQRVYMVWGYPTECWHGSGVPHRGFAWLRGTPQRVYMGLHQCLVFAVFWGKRPKPRQQIPQWQRSLHQGVRILMLKNRPNPYLCPSVTWWHSTCLAVHVLVLPNISSTAPKVEPPDHALTKKQTKLRCDPRSCYCEQVDHSGNVAPWGVIGEAFKMQPRQIWDGFLGVSILWPCLT